MNIQRKFFILHSLPLHCCFHLRNTRTKHIYTSTRVPHPCTIPFTCHSLRLAFVELDDNEPPKERVGLCIVEVYGVAVRLFLYRVVFQLSGRWLSGSPNIRIGLALPVNIFLL
jgi:hypothetical protein